MRARDDEIPGDEDLFRAVRPNNWPEWYADGRVSPAAIDSGGTSVQRSLFTTAATVRESFEAPVLFCTQPRRLPQCISADGSRYEAFAEDDPSDTEGEAHAEVRVRVEGSAERSNKRIKSKRKRLLVRQAIAEAFWLLDAD